MEAQPLILSKIRSETTLLLELYLHLIFLFFAMEAFKLQKKFPEVSRDEMFDLVNRFKWVNLDISRFLN
jgi:hypothetical protein